MKRIIGKRIYMRSAINQGTDKVISEFPIAHKGRLNNIWGEVHLLSSTAQSCFHYSTYGCDGYLIPLEDSNNAQALDTLWDKAVPKSKELTYATGTQNVEFDGAEGTSDTTTVFQPGELLIEQMFEMGPIPERIFNRTEWLSFAKNKPLGYKDDSGDKWIPNDYFRVNINKRYASTMYPSYVLFGLGQPDTTGDTSANAGSQNHMTGVQLMTMKFITEFMRFAFASQLGFADDSQDMSDTFNVLVDALVAEPVREETAGHWNGTGMQVLAPFTFDVSVPGLFNTSKPLSNGQGG